MKRLRLLVTLPLTIALLPFLAIGTFGGLAWAFLVVGATDAAPAIARWIVGKPKQEADHG